MTTPKSIDADGGTGPEVRVSSTGARLVVRDTGGAGRSSFSCMAVPDVRTTWHRWPRSCRRGFGR